MKLKAFSFLFALLAPISLHAYSINEQSAKFSVSLFTMAPGTTLKPGSYMIRVVDHLQDRFVLRIEGSGGEHTLFLGVPSTEVRDTTRSGALNFGTAPNGKAALRGFVFASGHQAIEFVYPKKDAVTLATLNNAKVLAVDPTSEGKSEMIASLSKDDMQMVSLWMLTPQTVVGGGNPKISASKYDQQIATLSSHRPTLKTLPHTASLLPVIVLVGLLSMSAAGLLTTARLSRAA